MTFHLFIRKPPMYILWHHWPEMSFRRLCVPVLCWWTWTRYPCGQCFYWCFHFGVIPGISFKQSSLLVTLQQNYRCFWKGPDHTWSFNGHLPVKTVCVKGDIVWATSLHASRHCQCLGLSAAFTLFCSHRVCKNTQVISNLYLWIMICDQWLK